MRINSLIPRDKLVKISIYRTAGQTSGVGGAPIELTPLVNTDVWAVVEKLSEGQAQRAFGLNTSSKWRVKVGADEDVSDNDLIQIDSGPYIDQLIEVNGIREPDGVLQILQSNDTDRVVKVA